MLVIVCLILYMFHASQCSNANPLGKRKPIVYELWRTPYRLWWIYVCAFCTTIFNDKMYITSTWLNKPVCSVHFIVLICRFERIMISAFIEIITLIRYRSRYCFLQLSIKLACLIISSIPRIIRFVIDDHLNYADSPPPSRAIVDQLSS